MNHAEITPNALGFILVGQGLISRGDLYLGLREHERTREPLGRSLIQLGLLSTEQLTDALAIQAHCPRLASGQLQELVRDHQQNRREAWGLLEATADVLVFGEHSHTLYLAVTDSRAIDSLLDLGILPELKFGVYVVSESDFESAKALLRGENGSERPAEATRPATTEASLGFGMCKIGYYEASEALFEAPDIGSLGAIAASALTHFFTHVAAIVFANEEFTLLAKSSPGDLEPCMVEAFKGNDVPYYGPLSDHDYGPQLCSWLGIQESPAILMACWTLADGFLVLVGAHAPGEDTYGDLNDVSGLFQEVETALNVLNNTSTNG